MRSCAWHALLARHLDLDPRRASAPACPGTSLQVSPAAVRLVRPAITSPKRIAPHAGVAFKTLFSRTQGLAFAQIAPPARARPAKGHLRCLPATRPQPMAARPGKSRRRPPEGRAQTARRVRQSTLRGALRVVCVGKVTSPPTRPCPRANRAPTARPPLRQGRMRRPTAPWLSSRTALLGNSQGVQTLGAVPFVLSAQTSLRRTAPCAHLAP